MQECCIVAIAAEASRKKFGGRGTDLRIRFKYLTKTLILCSLKQQLLEAPMLGDVGFDVHYCLLGLSKCPVRRFKIKRPLGRQRRQRCAARQIAPREVPNLAEQII